MVTVARLIGMALTLAATVAPAGPDAFQPPPAAAPKDLVLTGACDASAALLFDARQLVVADDEDAAKTTLRVYDLSAPGAPIGGIAATDALKPDVSDGEVDLEGLTRFAPSRFVMIGSHSRKKAAALDAPSRHRLVAFTLDGATANARITSHKRYEGLVRDAQTFLDGLPAADPMSKFVLDNKKGSKDGGLSIEGVTQTSADGELLIGLRSPLGPGGKAVMLVLKNAGAVLDSAAAASFASPFLLDLSNQGIRDVVVDGKGGYLIIAGEPGEGGEFSLWTWTGPGAGSSLARVGPIAKPAKKASAEALVVTPDKTAAWILFDEGERKNDAGVECKDLEKPADRSFHARRIALP